ncbi:hypothetical protein IWW48_003238 [Coemansia sp. RSA 1200]|nr:hypothetical protein IWW48_003238 [Coemansia sp. RSA 1200]
MQQKLKGARFRWINEALYTTTGVKAYEMMQNDPKIFEEYHQGFTSQVEKWPVNPVDMFIKQLEMSKKRLVVADMGCGEAKLAATVSNQHQVHSFDLVAYNKHITACNIANVPLDDGVADVVIFCLALMGTDSIKFIREANRILRTQGELWVAEVVSRIPNVETFVAALEEQGFKAIHKDTSNKMFAVFRLAKIGEMSSLFSTDPKDLLKPWMGKDLYHEFPASRLVFEQVDEVLGFRLSELMFEGDSSELTLTKNAQPAIVAVSIAILQALQHETGMDVADMYSAAMGHSVGEYSALVASRAMSLDNGIRLVRTRGESMQEAVKDHNYAMSACILRKSEIEDVVADVEDVQRQILQDKSIDSRESEVVQVANINSSSQIILSGTRFAVDRALMSLQSKRLAMRAVNLPVSAPFHCKLMAPAKASLAAKIAELSPVSNEDSWALPVISNVTAKPHNTAREAERLLVEQVDSPILWLQSMQYLKNIYGITRWGATGPGNVVGNLVGKEYANDIVRRLSDASAIRDFVAVLDRQEKRGY